MTQQQPKRRTWSGVEKQMSDLSATDLRQESAEAGANGIPFMAQQAYDLTIVDEATGTPFAEKTEALYLPGINRLGIAWGADATWADVDSLEQGMEMWLNAPDEWAQRA